MTGVEVGLLVLVTIPVVVLIVIRICRGQEKTTQTKDEPPTCPFCSYRGWTVCEVHQCLYCGRMSLAYCNADVEGGDTCDRLLCLNCAIEVARGDFRCRDHADAAPVENKPNEE